MDSPLIITDLGSHEWRTELPNIIFEKKLDPLAFRLYCQLKRVAGDHGYCRKSMRKLAEECEMSAGSVSGSRDKLESLNLIKVIKGDHAKGQPDSVIIRDLWKDNRREFFARYRKELPAQVVNAPLHRMNAPVHKVNATCAGGEQKKKNQLQEEPKQEEKKLASEPIHRLPEGIAIDADGEAASAEIIMLEWNKLAPTFPKIQVMTNGRRKLIKTRLKDDHWLNGWREALRVAKNVPFLCGVNDRGWRMNIDYFLQPDSVTKILEGIHGSGQRSFSKQPLKTVPLRENEVPRVANVDEELARLGIA